MRRPIRPRAAVALLAAGLLASGCGPAAVDEPEPASAAERLVTGYLESYFDTFPTRATAAGRHDRDQRLERLDDGVRRRWLELNRETARRARELAGRKETSASDRLDLELLERQAVRQVMEFEGDRRPRHDPLFWTGILGNATVFLLVRDDLPRGDRLTAAAARAAEIPALAGSARRALAAGDPASISPQLATLAARQAAASAHFYREGFAVAASGDPIAERLAETGAGAATALEELATFLDALAERATGSFRLGERYAERFRLVTGIDQPVDEVLRDAQQALVAKRAEAAAFGRAVWSRWMEPEQPPDDDAELLRRLFARLSDDRAATVDELVEDYRGFIDESIRFVRERGIVTLPDPLALWVGRSPAYFIGQSVGGVYAAGPYASPEAETLLFLPTPAEGADEARREAFFRDFNDHFNRMITPHEVVPGHYLQLAHAARHPRKLRALFGDGVYIEGWGTFCERLMLDLGWGDDLDRLAHLKKQLENIARTVVDIRVHTEGLPRERVLELVREEALQDEQFAGNMWRRAVTSSPQLTFYYLGYREVWTLFEEVRAARGDGFELRDFTDGMMELGPVPVRHYRARMLPASEARAD